MSSVNQVREVTLEPLSEQEQQPEEEDDNDEDEEEDDDEDEDEEWATGHLTKHYRTSVHQVSDTLIICQSTADRQ